VAIVLPVADSHRDDRAFTRSIFPSAHQTEDGATDALASFPRLSPPLRSQLDTIRRVRSGNCHA
jgi:hypothetical protein